MGRALQHCSGVLVRRLGGAPLHAASAHHPVASLQTATCSPGQGWIYWQCRGRYIDCCMLSCPRVPAGGRWPPLLSPLHRLTVSRGPALGVFTSPSCCWLCLDISKYYLDNVITDIISDNCSGYNMQPRRWSCVQTACWLLVSSINIQIHQLGQHHNWLQSKLRASLHSSLIYYSSRKACPIFI